MRFLAGMAGAGALAGMMILSAGSASALDGVIVVPGGKNVAQRDAGSRSCPALTRVKYPWLDCATDLHGNVQLVAPTIESMTVKGRHHPIGYLWDEGPAFWGPDL